MWIDDDDDDYDEEHEVRRIKKTKKKKNKGKRRVGGEVCNQKQKKRGIPGQLKHIISFH